MLIRMRLEGVGFRPAGRKIFEGLDWRIGDRERTGLVGPNGAGKSSLLQIAAGRIAPDDGRVVHLGSRGNPGDPRERGGLSLGYLPQQAPRLSGATVLEAAMQLPPDLAQVDAELARCEAKLADPAVQQSERRLARALARQEAALERHARLGGPSHAARVRGLLAHLGFGESQHGLPVAALSGGQRKLVALARLAAASPDLLFLDEPDNHLDLEAKQKLEAFVRDYPGGVVIVSHDRYLLDACASRIAELEGGRLTLYEGNYSAYAAQRELARLRQRKQYADQQKEIARIEAQIARFELWASMVVNERHMKQARSRRKRLERMEASGELVEKVQEDRRMRLEIAGHRGSRKALEIRGLAMGFDELLFEGVDLLVRHGERVALVGRNGCGKSVLFRLILGELTPLDGEIAIGPSTRVGYYAQEHQTLASWLDRTPLELVRDAAPMEEGAAVSLLLRLLFRYEQLRQPIRGFSGGERSRLQLARIMLEKPNLLLLDEPTNNLDIPSAEVLESVLEDFEGALLVISHDRFFLDTVVDRVVALEDGTLASYAGGYTDWREARGGG